VQPLVLLPVAGPAAESGDRPGPEHLPDHRGVLQQPLVRRRQQVQPRGDDALDRLGHRQLSPSSLFGLLGSCRSEWVFAHNLARHAGQGYASADMALWDFGPDGDDEGRLVAYATQVLFHLRMTGGGRRPTQGMVQRHARTTRQVVQVVHPVPTLGERRCRGPRELAVAG
jgi:hypothetical protein